MNINQELIPNKQILSIQKWKGDECKSYLLSMTRGMASRKQKRICYMAFMNELTDEETGLSEEFFKTNNNFEFWCGNELIGLCQNTASAQDWIQDAKSTGEPLENNDIGKLFLTCSLDAVFILKKYRGKGLGKCFSSVIRKVQFMNLYSLLMHLKTDQIKQVVAIFFCEYENKGGEHFHMELCAGYNGEYIKNTIKHLGYSYQGHMDASY